MQGSRIVLDKLDKDAPAPSSARRSDSAGAPRTPSSARQDEPAEPGGAVQSSALDLSTAPVLRGARIVVESLIQEGGDLIFGYPGGAILHVYDELYKVQDRLRHVLVRHEQGAVHATEGYAQTTHHHAPAILTTAPRPTNLVTALHNALMHSTPIVVI